MRRLLVVLALALATLLSGCAVPPMSSPPASPSGAQAGGVAQSRPNLVPDRSPPIRAGHPRIWLTSSVKAALRRKMRARDPSWLALKKQADVLATYRIYPYTTDHRTNEPDRTIFYDYEGE